ncbi:MAG: diaminopimelate decarboxylase [Woeseia sp.]|nr:diaminopimelate decarboxylase [Woeseia sp.]
MIESHFDTRGDELVIGGLTVSELSEQFGTPLFIYDQAALQRRIEQVKAVLPDRFNLFYSIKANPNAAILRTFLRQGCGLEVASGGELFQALSAGCPPDRVIFAGPGKTRTELAAALEADIREIHVESIDEIRTLSELATQDGNVARVALRINPAEASGGAMRMGGRASPFGIDEEELEIALDEATTLENVQVTGVHLFMATQILEAETLIEQYQLALRIAREVASRIPGPLASIDFGGGWGTPYFAHERELDLQELAAGIARVQQQMQEDPLLATAEAIIEPGRYLVNEAGLYLSRVTRVKRSRGRVFAITDGGMHHHLAASGNLGQTIKRNYPVAVVNKLERPVAEKTDVVGPLCTPLDMLARQIELPPVEPGDLFGVFQSGAYARTSSPHGFLSHASPAEVLVVDGRGSLIRRRGEPDDLLHDQVSATDTP